MQLAINLATRGRPGRLLNTISRTLVNIRHPETVFWVAADEDDADTIKAASAFGYPVRVSIRPREDSIGAKWNRVLEDEPGADVYLPMCDDAPHITPGFDVKILASAAKFPDGICVVFNHLENASFTGIQAVTRKLTAMLGWERDPGPQIYPTTFPYWFVDHWLDDVARIVNRIGFADVWLDSVQPPTQEMRQPEMWATLFDMQRLVRRRIAHAIIDDPSNIDEPWRKETLKDPHPLVEGRSRWINDLVRANSGLHAWAAQNYPDRDERYVRIKNRAKDIVRAIKDDFPIIEAEMTPKITEALAIAPNSGECYAPQDDGVAEAL